MPSSRPMVGRCDVGDGAVDDRERDAEGDGDDGPQAAGHRQPVPRGGGGGFQGRSVRHSKDKDTKSGRTFKRKRGVGVANAPKGKMLSAQMEGGKRRGWSVERREGWSGGACKTGRVDAEWKDGGRKNGEEAQNGEKASAKTGRVTGRKWRGGRRENGRADAKMRGPRHGRAWGTKNGRARPPSDPSGELLLGMVRKNRLLLDLPLPSLPPCRLFPGCRPFPGFVQALFLGYSCASRISLWLFPDSLRGLRGIFRLFPAFFRLPGPAGLIRPSLSLTGPHRPSLSPTGPPSTLILTNPFQVGGLRCGLLRAASVPGAAGLLPVVLGPAS